MVKLKKEFLFNVCLFSFLLSVLYSILLTNVDNPLVSNPENVSVPGGFVVFILFFLILYAIHVLISVLYYAVARIVGAGLTKRLILSNGIGIVLIGAVSLIAKQGTFMFLIFSLLVFSIISAIQARKAS